MDSPDAGNPSPDVVETARTIARNHRINAIETYRQKLLVAESAVQANRLIVNLDQVLERKGNEGENVAEALQLVQKDRDELEQALRDGSSTVILDVEARMEQLTLAHDPFYLENEDDRRAKRRQELDDKAKAGWMTEPSTRIIQFMKGDFKGKSHVMRSERRSCISRAAWIFAISGMAIAIVFLIIDFVTAQTHPVLRTEVVLEEKLPLPVMTFCMGYPNIGTFIDKEQTKIKGQSLFGITLYENFETGEKLSSKEAHEKVFEEVTLGPDSCRPTQKLKTFSRDHQQQQHPHRSKSGVQPRMNTIENCYACFRMNSSNPLILTASKAAAVGRPPIQVKLARHQFVSYCFSDALTSPNLHLVDGMSRAILEHKDELIEKGIIKVEVGTLDRALETLQTIPNNRAAPQYAGLSEAEFYNVQREFVENTNNFLCSVYFFSGFFYPVSGEKMDIRWTYSDGGTFDTLQRKWRQIGQGPYPKSYYFSDESISLNRTMQEELIDTELHDYRGRQHVLVYGLDHSISRLPNINDHAITLADRHSMILQFTRSVEHGVASFMKQSSFGSYTISFETTLFAEYGLEMGLASFERQKTSRRPATSVAEFLTDVFEYAGLFTGICAYSILVAPARIYLRRTAEATNTSPFK